MNFLEAKGLLLLHSFSYPDVHHPKMETGFLGSLRPYHGLKEDNFHEVMEAISALSPYLRTEPQIDREVIAALWSICEEARAWGIHPDGMLRRNDLIALQDVQRLERWTSIISYTVFILLDGGDLEAALEPYNEYKQGT